MISARALVKSIQEGSTSAVSSCERSLARITQIEPKISAFNTVIA